MTDTSEFSRRAVNALNDGEKKQAVILFTAAAVRYAKKGAMDKVDRVLHDDIFPLVTQEAYINIQDKVYGHWKEGKEFESGVESWEEGGITYRGKKGKDREDDSVYQEMGDTTIRRPETSNDSDTESAGMVGKIQVDSKVFDAVCWCLAKLWTDKGFAKQVGKRFPTAVGDVIKMRKKGKRLARKEK